jgi:1-acyl-sn-glycerol-3-phosphate acyltransferase
MNELFTNFKTGLMMLVMILNAILYYIFNLSIGKIIFTTLQKVFIGIMNVKIRVHGNTNNFSNNNLLIMSNHYEGVLDGNVIYNLYYKHNTIEPLYTIVKHNIVGDPTDKNLVSNLLSYIKGAIMNACCFIPYKRGDKEDGKNTRDVIVNSLREGKNVLVFPEGTAHRDGVPKDFKNGIFELAVENKLRILPITLKYDKDIGTEKGESFKNCNFFNNIVDVYIHDLIDENDECYKTNDFMALKQKTFNVISAPMGVNPHTPPI